MYMCYLDESGVQENAGTQYFVLSGLAIPDRQWKSLEQQVAQCKRRYGLESVEIHTAWIARRYIEQEQIPHFETRSYVDRRAAVKVQRDAALIRVAARRKPSQLKEAQKNYRKTWPYAHLTLDERRTLLQELADIIGSWREARLFAEVIDKHFAYSIAAHPYTPFEFAFRELIQRYEYFLLHRGHAIGETLYGILIQDNNETMARRLTDMMRMIHEKGTKWTNVEHIIETPLFVDSHLTSMVQMSDICAYAIRRFFENGEHDLFDRIHARFDRAGTAVVGIRHYTVDGCSCRVCQDHS